MSRLTAARAVAGAVAPILVATIASATVWHVDPSGTGDAPTIQAAVDSAAVGDTLLLAAGTFVGAGNKNVLFGGKDLVVVSDGGPASTAIDCEGDGRAFLYVAGEGPASVLRGVTIRNGHPASAGGAVMCVGASPSFLECVFEDNTAAGTIGGGGGAVFCSGGSPTFDDCVFRNNRNADPGGVGGAMSLSQCGDVTVTACTFEGNSADSTLSGGGGGLFAWFGSKLTVVGCDFRGNSARSGGGLAIIVTDEALVEATSFTENTAVSGGGLTSNAHDTRIVDCSFVRNEAGQGAGADVSSHAAEFVRCRFQRNTASYEGGGLANFLAAVTLSECVFSKNAAARGGGMYTSATATLVERCTFHANDADQGGAIHVRPYGAIGVSRTILAFNEAPPVDCGTEAAAELTCCDVYGNSGGDWVGCLAGQNGVAGNFSADPLFCAPDEKDFTIRSDSPCAPPGVTGCGLVGALPVGCGPVSMETETWARIKSRYRPAGR